LNFLIQTEVFGIIAFMVKWYGCGGELFYMKRCTCLCEEEWSLPDPALSGCQVSVLLATGGLDKADGGLQLATDSAAMSVAVLGIVGLHVWQCYNLLLGRLRRGAQSNSVPRSRGAAE
jgi:hypothetical protein